MHLYVAHYTSTACFTVRSEDDGAWQMLSGEDLDASEAMLVALAELVERDSPLLNWQTFR